MSLHSPHELVDFLHAAKYGCWLPLSPGGARAWGKTPENRCAVSTRVPPATAALIGTHHLKSKHSMTCVSHHIPLPIIAGAS